MIHTIKITPEFFYPVSSGEKPFEVRKKDRDYKVGDTLRFREIGNEMCLSCTPPVGADYEEYPANILRRIKECANTCKRNKWCLEVKYDIENNMLIFTAYTNRSIDARITYILDDEKYCKDGYCILGIDVDS